MTLPIPDSPAALDAGWLGAALGRRVGTVTLHRIGEDESFSGGGLYRLDVAGGETLVAKFSPTEPGLRAAMAAANRREVAFFTGYGAGLPVPQCHHGAFDEQSGASILLLEDLGGSRAHGFVRGLDGQQADTAVRALAQVHAAWWDRPEVEALQGAALFDEFDFAEYWRRYPAVLAAILPDVTLSPELAALGDRLARHGRAMFGALMERSPLTVLHRDCHADNLLFAADGSVRLLDWQISGRGRGGIDLGYALISSLPPALRRAEEPALIGRYCKTLSSRGVAGYGPDQARADYRRAAALKLFVSVVATVLLDNSTLAKITWRRADLERLIAFVRDHPVPEGAWA